MSTNFGIEDQGSRSGSASKSNEASIREDARSVPTIRDDASAQETSETPTVWMWVLTFVAGISGLLFGYDTGVISGALVVIGSDLGPAELSNQQKEFITAATSLGALLAGIVAGALADQIGRKWVVAIADVVFIVGAIMQALSGSVWLMVAGRFVIGIGVGLASLIVPLYLAELSPANYRGRMIIINVLFITFGQVVAYAIGAGLTHVHGGWRIMVGIGAVPAAAQFVILYWLPESPRYLIRKGIEGQAKTILSQIYKGASDRDLDEKVAYIKEFTEDRRPGTASQKAWSDFKSLYTVPSNLRALIIACGLQGIQQFSGFNSLMYFSATIFKSVGFENPTAVSLIVAGTNFVMTCVTFLVVDRIGRRRVLIGTLWGCAAGLTICAIAFHYLPRNDAGDVIGGGGNRWAILILASQIIYVMFYALGIGNIAWVGQSEVFPYNVRGYGTGMATATNWGANLILGSTFLTMMDKMTPSGAFGFYAILCFLGWLFVIFLYPDLSGFTLEEVAEILGKSFGIKESRRRRKELRRLGQEELRRREEALREKV
ncbi:uncharacterized protein H6S33_012163 [Morchella sextelata]|uniref:uncharacterized protein n=1 Tax=Morchella sextelata TaxID=1174677 RepID=UPI001D0409C3|nr:uncharacterized protein H6S33_012163 [Morchella sextelata]KAH0610636.1 hypothetical protein H6S33_012163 [Morchella sextelata]